MAAREHVSWRDRYPAEVTCVRCLEVWDQIELDRLLWCERCRAKARSRATMWGWVGGLGIGAGVAAYVWLGVQPSDLIVGAWIATVVAAVWIGSKVARELIYGAMRFRNARAVEAVPPVAAGADAPPPDGEDEPRKA